MWVQLMALAVAAAMVSADRSSATIEVDVATFRRPTGQLACRLYARAAGFPDVGTQAVGPVRQVTGTSAHCVFEHVAPGRYAVAVFHDEDGDLVLNKNLLGMPTEGYGVSNDATHRTQAPRFDEASFAVTSAQQVHLAVPLHY